MNEWVIGSQGCVSSTIEGYITHSEGHWKQQLKLNAVLRTNVA